MKPPPNKKPKRKQLIKLKCAKCLKQFFVTKQNYKKNRKNYFCSRVCNYEYKKPKKCKECGSKELYNPGWKRYPALCRACFDKWRILRHEKKVTCQDCGTKRIIKHDLAKNGFYKCPSCAQKMGQRMSLSIKIYYLNCRICGKPFISRFDNRQKCLNCLNRLNCWDCGIELNEKTQTHKSTHLTVCDLCMHERRRKYKDIAIYGRENINKMIKIRNIEALTIYGNYKIKGGLKCPKRQGVFVKKAQRLIRLKV